MARKGEGCHIPTSAAERRRQDFYSESAGKTGKRDASQASAVGGGLIMAVRLITSPISYMTGDANDLQLLGLGALVPARLVLAGG
jgi:hypothetical protein